MKRIFKVLLVLIVILVVAGGAGLGYLFIAFPKAAAAPDIKVDMSAANVARGKYLANHVMLCMDCHGQRDFSLFSGPPKPGTEGAGGDRFDGSMGFPGVFYARNITPASLNNWTDGELLRLLTTGVTKHNEVIFPVMPYRNYAKCDPEDLKAIIAYLRTVPAVAAENKPSKADFPLNILLRTMAAVPQATKRPDTTDLVKYGKYIANAAACNECHTAVDEKGEFTGVMYSGGRSFQFPDGTILTSPNITPHKQTGIGNWSEAYFVQRFKMHADSANRARKVQPGEMQSIMPWVMYGGMDTTDLRAIYAFLKSLDPVDNAVVKIKPPLAKN
ncbi:MAG: c-type cytochrome [Chitinophagaceae bacterium]|jgi:mono/diheme cytochrome c family protein|nr:c-type cytochrome [Chitinophagaceae bacterium]